MSVFFIDIFRQFHADADDVGFMPEKFVHFLVHDRLDGFGQFKMNAGNNNGSDIHACM